MPLLIVAAIVALSGCVSVSDALDAFGKHTLFFAAAGVLYSLVAFVKLALPRSARTRLQRACLTFAALFFGLALGARFPGLVPSEVGEFLGADKSVAGSLYFGLAGALASGGRKLARLYARRGQT